LTYYLAGIYDNTRIKKVKGGEIYEGFKDIWINIVGSINIY